VAILNWNTGFGGFGLFKYYVARQIIKIKTFSDFYPNIPIFHHSTIPFRVDPHPYGVKSTTPRPDLDTLCAFD
jgi:hypothetical protein